jgi:hypothetical protein
MFLYTHERNFGCRLYEVIYKGLKTIFLENEKIKVGILVDRGTDIFEFLYKPKDIDFMWRSYLGIKKSNFLPASYLEEGNFLDFYHGGWQELFPNGGDPQKYKGALLPQHGELYTIPWDYQILKDEPDEVKIKFTTRTYRTYFHIEKIISIKTNEPVLFFKETITNESRENMDFMWGQHPAIGPPFLSENCVVDLPDCDLLTDEIDLSPTTGRLAIGHKSRWPITIGRSKEKIDLSEIPGIEANSHDRAYIFNFDDGWFAVTNQEFKVGFGMNWDKKVFKYMWFWQVYGGAVGYPWYSTTYNIALEPNSSYPPGLNNSIKSKTNLSLGPGERLSTDYLAVAFETDKRVKKIDEQGKILNR